MRIVRNRVLDIHYYITKALYEIAYNYFAYKTQSLRSITKFYYLSFISTTLYYLRQFLKRIKKKTMTVKKLPDNSSYNIVIVHMMVHLMSKNNGMYFLCVIPTRLNTFICDYIIGFFIKGIFKVYFR